MTRPFVLAEASIPLLISFPHNGSLIPDELADEMTAVGRSSIDTDWYLDRLYHFAALTGAGRLIAKYSRYVVDLNRPRSGESLYPGQTTTGLFPTESFAGEPLFQQPRDTNQNARWIEEIWLPWHNALAEELNRLKEQFGFAVLLEAHSIASVVPRLFEGRLPDFNFGTNHGESCGPEITKALEATATAIQDYSRVFNGRFVGGYITRHYGDPANNIHAVQLELSQATYLHEDRKAWSDAKVQQVRPLLVRTVNALINAPPCRQKKVSGPFFGEKGS